MSTVSGHGGFPDRNPPSQPGEIRLPIKTDTDIVASREIGRTYARLSGLSSAEATIVATVISELARNILAHAGRGEVAVAIVDDAGRRGVRVTALDEGGGLVDHPAPLSKRLLEVEHRLDAIKQSMDEFNIVSEVGKGTIVTLTKWNR